MNAKPVIYQALTKNSPNEWVQISERQYLNWDEYKDIQAVRKMEVSGFYSRESKRKECRAEIIKNVFQIMSTLTFGRFGPEDVVSLMNEINWKHEYYNQKED